MSRSWEKTFEFSGPVEEVFGSFIDGSSEHRVWDPENAYLSGGAIEIDWIEREPNRRLSWDEKVKGNTVSRMSVTFAETETGSRITITAEGFGDLPEHLHLARLRGWTEMLWDLEVWFRTGTMLDRLHHRAWGRFGLNVLGAGPGLEVVAVGADGPAASSGIEPGDLVVRIAGAPVFEVGDLWLLESALPDGAEVDFEFFRGAERREGRSTLAATPLRT